MLMTLWFSGDYWDFFVSDLVAVGGFFVVRSLDKAVAALQMEVAASKTKTSSEVTGLDGLVTNSTTTLAPPAKPKVFMVIGINTAFSSRKRRDSVRETWMPQGILIVLFISLFGHVF